MVEVNIINFEKDLGIKNIHIHKQEIKIKNRTEREVLTFEVVKLQQFLCRGRKGPFPSSAKICGF